MHTHCFDETKDTDLHTHTQNQTHCTYQDYTMCTYKQPTYDAAVWFDDHMQRIQYIAFKKYVRLVQSQEPSETSVYHDGK
jgi:hypothetical protein